MLRSVLFVAIACSACASRELVQPAETVPTRESSPAPAPDATPVPTEPVAAVPENASSVSSNAGTYVVRFAPEAARMPNNAPFELELWIADGAHPDAPAREISLAVDAAMPEHGHGMVRAPVVERLGDGHFVARGVLLHMTGRWELYFDVTRGAVTERAQISAMLE